VEDTVPALMSFDFRTGDTVWLLLPITAFSRNGHGTYRYDHGRLVLRYAEGSEDSARIILRSDTMGAVVDGGQGWTATATRIAAARGRRDPLHGTWAERDGDDQLTLTTYLPDGVFFTESAIVTPYSADTAIVTIEPSWCSRCTMNGVRRPWRLRIEVQGTDTVLSLLDVPNPRAFRRPRCKDARFDPRTTFTSVCS
jgi:hypothetical protein